MTKRANKPAKPAARPGGGAVNAEVSRVSAKPKTPRIRQVPVAKIRPEEGLGRKRDREGHADLCRSIAQFGVLTPITVRPAPDDSGDFLLIKGQGRTLACALLGIKTIPAVVVGDRFAETEKVQQFLVENVARLRMRPIDRALLIARARKEGEETAAVAKRFGVTAATVRRLDAQLEGASSGEVAALRSGDVSLALHSVVARHVVSSERTDVVNAVAGSGITSSEMRALFIAFDWHCLSELGPANRADRLALLRWAVTTLMGLPRGDVADRMRRLALRMPMRFPAHAAEALG